MNITIVKEEYFRSQPCVNITDNMVRATIIVPKREWIKFKNELKRVQQMEEQRARVIGEIFDMELELDS